MKTRFFIDWLAFDYIAKVTEQEIELNCLKLKEPNGTQLVKLPYGTNVFNSRYFVLDEHGVKKLTILCDPISKIIAKNLVLIQVENACFYDNTAEFWVDKCKEIHEGEFGNINRVDICCDFDEHGETFAKILDTTKVRVKRYAEGSSFYYYEKDKDNPDQIQKRIKQISWGAKSSSFKWKLYNKSKEIKEESKKFYIEQCWRNAQFNISKDVWRLEVSITKLSQISLRDKQGFDLLSIFNLVHYKNAWGVFHYLFNNKFVMFKNGTDKTFLFKYFGGREDLYVEKKTPSDLVKYSTELLINLKRLVEICVQMEVLHNYGTKYKALDLLANIIQTANLDWYLELLTGMRWQEFRNNFEGYVNYKFRNGKF